MVLGWYSGFQNKQIIANKYEILAEIGSGGNAKVYKVKNINGQEYALKQLHRDARQWANRFRPQNKEMRTRFIDEITTILDNHKDIDGIIPIMDFSKKVFGIRCLSLSQSLNILLIHLHHHGK